MRATWITPNFSKWTASARSWAETGGRTISPDGLLSEDGLKNLIEAGIQTRAVTGAVNLNNAMDFVPLREVLREFGMR